MKGYAKWLNLTTELAEDHQKMGEHVTQLTGAYEALNNSYNALTGSYNALVKDLNELIR